MHYIRPKKCFLTLIFSEISAKFAEKYFDMHLKWIFFDIDNTLFDFSKASLTSLNILYDESSELKHKFSSAETFIDEFHIHNTLMWQLHEKGEITSDFLRSERFRLTVTPERRDDKAVDFARRLDTRYLDILGSQEFVCPGAFELLDRLKGNYLIGALTNGFTYVQYKKLRSTGLGRYLQRMVISDEIGIQKPDRRIFRYAEQAVGVSADEILMIGDNPVSDVQGALSAGWHAVYYDRMKKGESFDSPLYLGRFVDFHTMADSLFPISRK